MLQDNKDFELDRTRLPSAEQGHVRTPPFSEQDESCETGANADKYDHGLYRFLPVHIRGPIHEISSANQYIKITTEHGSFELRMPLRDAIRLLSEDEGLKVHRSFWIAKSQIKRLVYESGNPRVIDCKGKRLPVSRPMVPAIKTVLKA